jgi:hypothetical protein
MRIAMNGRNFLAGSLAMTMLLAAPFAQAEFAARGGGTTLGRNGAATAHRGAAADGSGNVAARRQFAFTTESGARGQRQAKFRRQSDGSANASANGSLSGENGSVSRNASYSRDTNGNTTRESSVTCKDASGASAACESLR